MTDVVVVGGGITGLTTAHRLQEAGLEVTLLERSRHLGGLVETTTDDGFLIESGPDSFVTGKGSILTLAERLGLDSEVIASKTGTSSVWFDGQLHPLPGGLLLMVPARLGPFLGSSLLSWRGKSRALADLVLPRKGNGGDESLGSFVRRRLGDEVLHRIAEPLVAGIHGAEPETMSLRASFPRFLDMEAEHRSLILAARRALAAAPPDSGRTHFSSFRQGMGQLTTALIGSLGDADIRLETEVSEISAGTGGFEVGLGSGDRLQTRAVVVATPAPIAGRLLAGVAPVAAGELVAIGQTATTAVTFAFRRQDLPPLDGSGFVVPPGQVVGIRGVSFLSEKWEGRVPDDDFSLLRVFLSSSGGIDAPEEAALTGLKRTLGVEASPVRTWARSHPQGLHRYILGHLDRVTKVRRSLSEWPGLAVAGAALDGVGLNECVLSGWKAADSILETVAANL